MSTGEKGTALLDLEVELKRLREEHFGEALTNLITRKTPEEVIRDRPGRGRLKFRYVPIAWFIDQLNSLFGFDWDFEILDQGVIKDKHIWVKGKLTVRTREEAEVLSITKTQYGGSEVKLAANTSQIIDYADDLKAAASDCLKKCATLLGLAWDVYSGEREALTSTGPTTTQLLAFYKRAEKAGMDKDAADEWFQKQSEINPEGKKPDEVVEADLLGAIPILMDMAKEKKDVPGS